MNPILERLLGRAPRDEPFPGADPADTLTTDEPDGKDHAGVMGQEEPKE